MDSHLLQTTSVRMGAHLDLLEMLRDRRQLEAGIPQDSETSSSRTGTCSCSYSSLWTTVARSVSRLQECAGLTRSGMTVLNVSCMKANGEIIGEAP